MADDLLKEVTDFFKDGEKDKKREKSFANVNKASTLIAARDFHDSIKVKEDPSNCRRTLTQLLYLQQNAVEKLNHIEATEVFFGVTKLFFCSDSSLRRMVYVALKELYKLCDASDVIIVTSCLTKDMTCSIDVYRANALRVLVRIIDSSMLSALERYVKQAIIHKSPLVASSALVSSLQLYQKSPENASIVKRWIGEVNEAMKNNDAMVQFHATELFYQIKENDRLAISKFVQKHSGVVTNGSSSASRIKDRVRSPLAIICLIRYTSKLMHEEVMEGRVASDASIMNATEICAVGYRYFESCLRHEVDIVAFEAAKAICTLPTTSPEVVLPALSVLQLSLSSTKPASRLATVKLLCGLASLHPRLVSRFNEGLEALIGDPNRLIGTLSMMTLLKTGTENSLDRLLKSISNFLYQIAEEYKVMVVHSLELVCLTYPTKSRIVIGFLSKFLRDEGGFLFKKTIVKTIVSLIQKIPEDDVRDIALLYLCEFIEDCEFVNLSTEIIHLIGQYGPQASSPARYVRFIYNRCILEKSAIRASAISALTTFAIECPDLRHSILPLLKSCLTDEDDETRDRVVLALNLIGEDSTETNADERDYDARDKNREEKSVVRVLTSKLPMSFDNLALSLKAYQKIPGAMEAIDPLSFDNLPIVEGPDEIESKGSGILEESPSNLLEDDNMKKFDPAAAIYAIPELASFGRVFKSCNPIPVTEAESEYVVTYIKHILDNFIILQFMVQNTIEDQRLENVSVALQTDSAAYEVVGEIEAKTISYGHSENCYTVLERNVQEPFEPFALAAELKFTVVQVDPETGEGEGDQDLLEEEYPLEDLEIFNSDFVAKTTVVDFRKAWESIGNTNEILQKFGLGDKTIQSATIAVVDCLGMQTCDGTGQIKPGSKQHMLHLSGTYLGGVKVLARCQIAGSKGVGTILKIAIRSESKEVSKQILESL